MIAMFVLMIWEPQMSCGTNRWRSSDQRDAVREEQRQARHVEEFDRSNQSLLDFGTKQEHSA